MDGGYIPIRIEEIVYYISVTQVKAVINLNQVEKKTSKLIIGTIKIDDSIVNIYDIRNCLGNRRAKGPANWAIILHSNNRESGIAVDEVLEISKQPEDGWKTLPSLIHNKCIKSIGYNESKQKLALLLDIEVLFDEYLQEEIGAE